MKADVVLGAFTAHDALITAARVLVTIALAWGLHRLATRLIRVFRVRVETHMTDAETIRRAETLARVVRYLATVIISLITGMLVLSEVGISVAPILGAAGVVGVAVGFGAQSLVKDYFTGFFLLLENQVAKGDAVEVAGKSGQVEDVTLRYVQLRDYDGNVHFIPNSLITTVTNMSRGFAYAVVDVSVAYREHLVDVYAVMRAVAARLQGDPVFSARILEPLEIAGVERWDSSAVIIRCRFKVSALEQANVRREFLGRLKDEFDTQGIEIPQPHLTLYAGAGKDGSAPPFRVLQSGGRSNASTSA